MLNKCKCRLMGIAALCLLASCDTPKISAENDERPWVSLFNGKDLEGWTVKFKGFPAGVNYRDTFRVEDGLLTVSYDNWEQFEPDRFGHIFTDKSYSHYRIRLEYRFIGKQITQDTKYAWAYRNNGVMLHSSAAEEMELQQAFPVSAEAQFLGGNGATDRPTGNFCSPGTNIIKDGELITSHCLKSSAKTYHGDQWVKFEAQVYQNGRIKHLVNDELVFEYDELQLDPNDKYAAKLMARGKPIKIVQGHIAFQAETHPTQFRNIEIQAL